MPKQTYTRDEVILIIDDILQMPDAVTDAIENENTNVGADDLLKAAEHHLKF